MTAPTVDEIRQATIRQIQDSDAEYRPDDFAAYVSDGVCRLWREPGETHPIDEYIDLAEERVVERCIAIAIEEYTLAALAFATAHPDAPRTNQPVSAA